jgi:hypothetical protein
MIVEQHTSLLDLADAGLKARLVELAADYQGDPNLQQLVPPAVREALEPHWRALTDNRPHRIGGFHDGLQSEPEDGTAARSAPVPDRFDEAMHWMWGDAGAISSSSRRAILPRDASTRPKSASNNPDRHGLGGVRLIVEHCLGLVEAGAFLCRGCCSRLVLTSGERHSEAQRIRRIA